MFDLGFSELFLIAIVALVVLGPERLPKAARFAGVWIKRARSQWQSVKSEFESQLADEELSGSLRETRDQLHDVKRQLQERGESLRSDFELDSDHDDSDHDEAELGSASDPELKAMMEPEDEPEPSPPEPEEPGPDQPERREPDAPAPTRRDPPPGKPGDPAPDQRLDAASMGDRADEHATPAGPQRP